jgi:hypothetical protein
MIFSVSRNLILITLSIIIMAVPHRLPAQEATSDMRIAVMPYIMGKNPESIEETMTCPYSSFCYDPDSIKKGVDIVLTNMLQKILQNKFAGKIVPLAEVRDSFEILKFGQASITPQDMVLKIGKELNVDYVVAGNVWRFRERVGRSFSVETPASVAFAVYLVDIKESKLIWMARFDETQQSLFSNLLNARAFFKQGAKWLTAQEFADYGMNEIMSDFPLK